MSAVRVHPSAVVDPRAELGEDVEVGPLVVIEAGVSVGARTRLLSGTVLMSGSRIGADCILGPYASIGGLPMDTSFRGERSFVELADHVQVRDFASVHRATGEDSVTRIGTGSLLMTYVHVSHNATVGDHAVLTSAAQLGGHSHVGDRAVLGAGASLHQFVRVGSFAMVGAMSGLNRDALPFSLVHGLFAEHYSLNRVGLKRSGLSGDRYRDIERAFRLLRRRDRAGFEELARQSADAALMRDFINGSSRGIAAFRRSGRGSDD